VGEEQFLQWINNTTGSETITDENTTYSGNQNLTNLTPISFGRAPLPNGETDFSRVEYWEAYSDLYDFYPLYYQDDLVIYQNHYYLCLQEIQNDTPNPLTPNQDSTHWEDMGACTLYDALITQSSSIYSDMGIE